MALAWQGVRRLPWGQPASIKLIAVCWWTLSCLQPAKSNGCFAPWPSSSTDLSGRPTACLVSPMPLPALPPSSHPSIHVRQGSPPAYPPTLEEAFEPGSSQAAR